MLDRPGKPGLIAIVVLTMNQREKTLRCLASLREVEDVPSRVLLWDNSSKDSTAEAVMASFPEVLVHRHDTNLGVASGRNAAALLAANYFDCTHLLFLDNDTTVSPDFLRLLAEPFEQDGRLAQTTPKIRFYNDPKVLYGARGCGINFWMGRTAHIGYREIDRGQYDERVSCIPSGGCMLVRRDVFEELGGFDSRYDPYGPEDLDFGLRVQAAGYRALYIPEAVIFHDPEPGKTVSGGQFTESYAWYRARHWLRFLAQHGTTSQKTGFFLIGAPYLLSGIVIREGRRGNWRALKGLARGGFDFVRSALSTSKES